MQSVTEHTYLVRLPSHIVALNFFFLMCILLTASLVLPTPHSSQQEILEIRNCAGSSIPGAIFMICSPRPGLLAAHF